MWRWMNLVSLSCPMSVCCWYSRALQIHTEAPLYHYPVIQLWLYKNGPTPWGIRTFFTLSGSFLYYFYVIIFWSQTAKKGKTMVPLLAKRTSYQLKYTRKQHSFLSKVISIFQYNFFGGVNVWLVAKQQLTKKKCYRLLLHSTPIIEFDL